MASKWNLEEEAARFREWAEKYPAEERSGEWECDYSEWNQLYEAVLNFIASQPLSFWTPKELETILYLLARDNETQYLAASIRECHPQMLFSLATAALEYGEPDVRWQLAVELGRVSSLTSDGEGLLLRMAADADEYVRRRALMELARLNSPHTEELAVAAWYQPHENQQWARMAALWSLHKIQSPLLENLLTDAEADPRSNLMHYAQRFHYPTHFSEFLLRRGARRNGMDKSSLRQCSTHNSPI